MRGCSLEVKSMPKKYLDSQSRIQTIFQYKINMIYEADIPSVNIRQEQTGVSIEMNLTSSLNEVCEIFCFVPHDNYFKESELHDIAVTEISYVAIDFLFFLGKRIGNRYLKILSDGNEQSELQWVKDIIPQAREVYNNFKFSYVFPINDKTQIAYQAEWREIITNLRKAMWQSYAKDYYCKEFMKGTLDLLNVRRVLLK